MKKNKFYILLSIIVLICFFGTAAICNQCAADTAEEVDSTAGDEVTSEEEGEIPESEEEKPWEGEEDTEEEETPEEEEETEEETSEQEEQKEAPTITLEIYEGPIYSSADDVCYYRIKAIVTGSPTPSVEFSKDDSGGAWGSKKAQVNLSDPAETYTLTATATNSEDTATDSIDLSWGCPIPISPPEIDEVDTQIILSESGTIENKGGGVKVASSNNWPYVGDSIDDNPYRGYVSFDISSITGIGAQVDSATLRFKEPSLQVGDPSVLGNIYVYSVYWGARSIVEDDYNLSGDLLGNIEHRFPFGIGSTVLKNSIQFAMDSGRTRFQIMLYHNLKTNNNGQYDTYQLQSSDIEFTIFYVE